MADVLIQSAYAFWAKNNDKGSGLVPTFITKALEPSESQSIWLDKHSGLPAY
jgi:hypothetical protein